MLHSDEPMKVKYMLAIGFTVAILAALLSG
jgi:hypothetical protein